MRLQSPRKVFPEIQTGYELNSYGWFSVILPLGSRNIIKNPSLETNATGYNAVAGGTIARTSIWQAHGAISLQYTPSANVNDGVYYGPTEALEANKQYWAQFKFNGDGGRRYKAYLATTAGAQVGAAKQFTATGNTDFIVFPYFETSALARRLYIVKDNDANVRPFFIDGLKLEKNTFWTTYHDGDMTSLIPNFDGYYWEGSPHSSASVRVDNEASGGRVINLKQIGLAITAVIGLGFGGQQPILSPQGSGGEFYQGTQTVGRDFSLIGEVGRSGLVNLDVPLQALEDLFGADRISPQQPVVFRYEPLDDCGGSLGRTLDIPCEFKSGLELNRDNPDREKLALTFRLYFPFVAKNADEFGTTILYQDVITSVNRLLQRNSDGVWSKISTGATGGDVDAVMYSATGRIYIGGAQTGLGGVANTRGVGYYDPTDGLFHAMGTGAPAGAEVFELLELPDGRIVAVGNFASMSAVANTANIAVYDPVLNTWAAFGNANSIVRSITYYPQTGTIYVVGDFTNIGGSAISWAASTTNGTTFSALTGSPLTSATYRVLLGRSNILYIIENEPSGVNSFVRSFNISTSAWSVIQQGGGVHHGKSLAVDAAGKVYWGRGTGDCMYMWNGTAVSTIQCFNGSGPEWKFIKFDRWNIAHVSYNGSGFTMLGVACPSYFLYNLSANLYTDTILPQTFDNLTALDSSVAGSLALAFNDTGTVKIGKINTVNNPGSVPGKVKIKFIGPGVLYQVKNYTTNAALYFNLTLQDQEIAILDLTGDSPTFTSNIRGNIVGSLLPGSNTSNFTLANGNNNISFLVDYTAVETNDSGNELSAYSLQGVTTTNSDNGRLYVNIVNLGGANRRVDFYSDSARTLLVAQTGTYSATGSQAVTQANSSGISGTINIDAVGAANVTITIDVPVVSMSLQPAYASLSGAVMPRLF